MANCTMVFMPYCDGSSFTADRGEPWPVPNTTTPQHLLFRGRRNFVRTLDILARDWGLGDAADVVLYGGSAGGLSTYLNLDYVQQRLPAARVVGMPVAGYFLDHAPAPFAASVPPNQPPFQHVPKPYSSYPQAIRYMVGMHNTTGQLDPECRAHFGPAEAWQCAMAPHMQSFVKAPFFAVQSRFDEFQLGKSHGYRMLPQCPHTHTPTHTTHPSSIDPHAACCKLHVGKIVRYFTTPKNVLCVPTHALQPRPSHVFHHECTIHTLPTRFADSAAG